jgi:hypothetical protein
MARHGAGNLSSPAVGDGRGAEIHPTGDLHLFRRPVGAEISGRIAGGGAACVRVLVASAGSWFLPDVFFNPLIAAGAEVRRFKRKRKSRATGEFLSIRPGRGASRKYTALTGGRVTPHITSKAVNLYSGHWKHKRAFSTLQTIISANH